MYSPSLVTISCHMGVRRESIRNLDPWRSGPLVRGLVDPKSYFLRRRISMPNLAALYQSVRAYVGIKNLGSLSPPLGLWDVADPHKTQFCPHGKFDRSWSYRLGVPRGTSPMGPCSLGWGIFDSEKLTLPSLGGSESRI